MVKTNTGFEMRHFTPVFSEVLAVLGEALQKNLNQNRSEIKKKKKKLKNQVVTF